MAGSGSRSSGWAARLGANLLALAMIALAAHSWPVREYVRQLAAVHAGRALDATVSIGSLRYNVLTLDVDAENVHVAWPPDVRAASLFARRVLVGFSWQALAAGRIQIEHVDVPHLDASVTDEVADVHLNGLRVSLRHRASQYDGEFDLRGPGRVQLGDRTHPVRRLRGAVHFANGAVHVTDVDVKALGLQVTMDGRVDRLGTGAPRPSLAGTWRGDVSELCRALSVSCRQVQHATLRGRVSLDGDAAFPIVTLEGGGEARIDGLSSRVVIDGAIRIAGLGEREVDLASADVDVAIRLQSIPGPGVPVSGTGSLQVRQGRWTLRAMSAKIGETTEFDGAVSGPLVGDTIAVWADAPIAGTLHLRTADARELLRAARDLGLNDLAPSSLPGWQASGSANLTLAGTLGQPQVGGQLDVVAELPATSDRIEAAGEVQLDRARVRIGALNVTRGPAHVVASLSYEWQRRTIHSEFAAAVSDLGALAAEFGPAGWPLSGYATASGRIEGRWPRPHVQAEVHAGGVEVIRPPPSEGTAGVPLALGAVDARVSVTDRVAVDVELPDRQVTATATMGLDPDAAFEATIAFRELTPSSFLEPSGFAAGATAVIDGEAFIRGHWQRLADVRADIRLTRLDASLHDTDAALARPARLTIDAGRVVEADVEARVGALSLQVARASPDVPLALTAEGRLPPLPVLQGQPAEVSVDALIDERVVAIRRASGRWGEATLEGSAEIPSAFVKAWLRNEHSVTGDESGPAATARLDVRNIPVFQLAASLTDVDFARAAGTVDVVMAATAERPALEALQVDGRVERGRLELAGVRVEQQGSAALLFDRGSMSLAESRWTAPGVEARLRANAPMEGGRRQFEVGVAGDLDLSTAVARAQERLDGTVHVDLTINGDGETVTWNGGVRIQEGAWVARQQGVALADVEAALTCATAECRIDSFVGRLNGGTVTLRGAVPMPGAASAAALDASVRGAGFELPQGTRHDVDADLTLRGGDKPQVAGTVTVWPAAISESLLGLAGLVSSLRQDGAPETEPSMWARALSAIALDVAIDAGDSLVVDSADVEAAATANLRVRGTMSNPRLTGEVAMLEVGRVFVAGREWRIEQGTVSLLDATSGANVQLSATLAARISKYDVSINLSGPASRPALVMSADPPLPQSDLAELVLTGTTSGTMGRSSTQRVATLVSTDLLTNVGRTVGIDAIRIEQSTSELSTVELEPVSRLTISKRLTERFEVVYSQGLGDEDDLAWVLVWRPGRHALDVRATIRTSGSEAIELRQELEFGGPARRARAVSARPAPRRVSGVEVVGVPEEEARELRSVLSLRAGDAFTSAAWQLDRERLVRHYQSRDRLRARVRATQARVTDGAYALSYHVAPGPVTQLDVRGYDIDDRIAQVLRDAWSNALSEELVSDALTERMRLELAAAGYLDAEVVTRLTAPQGGMQSASIEVAAGRRARRRAIVFTGNRAVADRDLQRSVSAAQLEPECWLDPTVINPPLLALYRARGFLAAQIDTTRAIVDDRGTLQVRIDEGPAFTVGAVTFDGVTGLGEEAARTALALAAGASFSDAALSSAAARVRLAYARAGHLEAEVETSTAVHRSEHLVDVRVTVREGVTSVLRGIQVTGGAATSPKLVSRAVRAPVGQPIDRLVLDQSQQRLYETGIFRTVGIEVTPADASSVTSGRLVDAVVSLEERAKYRLRYGVQFGPTTLESLAPESNASAPGATIDIQRRNLYGIGLVVGAGGVWSGDQHRVRATASAPTFGGRPVSTTFTVEHANQDRDSDEYQLHIVDRSVRSILEQRWRFTGKRRVEVAYGFDIDWRRLDLQSTTEAPLPLRARYAGLTGTLVYDARDNAFNPHRGMLHTSRVETGAGLWLSDVAFVRYQFQQFFYYPVQRLTLASGVRFGTLDVDNERQPTSLLLFFRTGGSNSVRGYDDDALTPGYVLGVPAGGKVLLVMNQEVRIPIWRRIGAVAFVDAGNTFLGLDAVALNTLKVGAGAGVRFDTPVAVLRFDVGFPVPRLTGQPRARWYLSLGQAF